MDCLRFHANGTCQSIQTRTEDTIYLTLPEFQHVTTDVTTAADDMPKTNDIPRKRTTGTYNDFNRRSANFLPQYVPPCFSSCLALRLGNMLFPRKLRGILSMVFLQHSRRAPYCCPIKWIEIQTCHILPLLRPFCPRDPSVCIVRCENHFT